MKKYIFLIVCHIFFSSDIMADPINLNKTDANVIGHVVDKKNGRTSCVCRSFAERYNNRYDYRCHRALLS